MPYRKQLPPLKTTPDRDYWIKFLANQGLISEVPIEEPISSRPVKPSEPEGELSPDMFTFTYRVAERLTSLDGLPEDARSRALKVREQIRQDLRDVFLGKESFDVWFNRTKTQHGLHTMTFVRILYDSLDGLKSEDARGLRAEYGQMLNKLVNQGV
jgi:hypothetical protein